MPLRTLFLLAALAAAAPAQAPQPACSLCAQWNRPQQPFRIYGNTFYVGPHGLSSILITSPQGHILIDGGLPESAPLIAEHIRALGFRPQDIKLILSTHAHFDHAGGIAQLQRLTGAQVLASPWSAAAFRAGGVPRDDPQFGDIRGIARIAHVKTLADGQVVRLGPLALTAHFTPGHTPGGTTWTWQSCEANRCLNLILADSLSAVAAPGYKFTAHPQVLADFNRSLAYIAQAPCDILLTPHPEASNLYDRLAARDHTPDAFINPAQCSQFATAARAAIQKRISSEAP